LASCGGPCGCGRCWSCGKVVKSYLGGRDRTLTRSKLLQRVSVLQQTSANFSRHALRSCPNGSGSRFSVHICVTRCHKLSQQLSYQSRRVTECQYICRHVNKLTYVISSFRLGAGACASAGVASGRASAPLGSALGLAVRLSYPVSLGGWCNASGTGSGTRIPSD
jgi:hypothetical protein